VLREHFPRSLDEPAASFATSRCTARSVHKLIKRVLETMLRTPCARVKKVTRECAWAAQRFRQTAEFLLFGPRADFWRILPERSRGHPRRGIGQA
jgi:hypothetical protein